MKEHIIIGTAGHIDHGKTALIRALTGIDTDRLKEEKERGITIDIGFAYWRDNITIIDVPGHEKFIRNMVAGVNTIDFFLLVIAADDGIMPQTVEHLDILTFFNIRNGIVVINKIDLIDQHRLEQLQQEVKSFLKKYHLEHLPVIPVSAAAQVNIHLLQQEIENKIHAVQPKHSLRPFRLSIDRSFQIKGFGTIVTGTVLSGTVHKGDEVAVFPEGKKVRVRGLQVHTQEANQIKIGFRAAVNLSDLDKEGVVRGDVLAPPGSMLPVIEFSGIMHTISSLPLKIKNRSLVHVYTGTAEKAGQILWHEDSRYLEPNTIYHIRLKLHKPVAAVIGDAFLIRLPSPVLTLAGGRILEINPPRISAIEKNWLEYYSVMDGINLPAKVERIILEQGVHLVSIALLQAKLFESYETIQIAIDDLINQHKIISIISKGFAHFIHSRDFELLSNDILKHIEHFHQQYPLKLGINLQELSGRLGKTPLAEEVLLSVLQNLQKNKVIKQEQNTYSLADFAIQFSTDKNQITSKILEKLKVGNFSPPDIHELGKQLSIDKEELRVLLRSLDREKQIVGINSDLYLYAQALEQVLQFLRNYFDSHNQLPVTALKYFMSTSRKYTIPIFEYLDAQGFTVRTGIFVKRVRPSKSSRTTRINLYTRVSGLMLNDHLISQH